MSTSIFVTMRLVGFHRWPNATGTRAYLAQRHRHLFGIRAEVPVSHDDRDVEFHDLADIIRDWWGPLPHEWDTASCESIARQLQEHLTTLGIPGSTITVDEDGENGATVRPDEERHVSHQ